MEQKDSFNVFDNTKPLFAATGYGMLAAVLLLIIPFLPFYDGINVFEAFYETIDSLSGVKNFEIAFYLLVSQWFVFAVIIFTVYLVIKIALALVKVKRAKQFVALLIDKIYISMLFMLVSFLLVSFVLNVFYSEFQQFGVYPIIPKVYVYFYGIIALVGIVVNIVCKNLCSPLKFSKGNVFYYIGIISFAFILILIAEFSSVLYAGRGYSSYSVSLFSSVADDSMFIGEDEVFYINLNVFDNLMRISEVAPAFLYFPFIILLVDILFVFNAFIIAVKKILCNNCDFILSQVMTYGYMSEEKHFTFNRKFYAVKNKFGIWSIILGAITLLFHLIAYPIVKSVGGLSINATFSVAPVFGVCLLICGIAALFGVKYINGRFAEPEEKFVNSENSSQGSENVSISETVSDGESCEPIVNYTEIAVNTTESNLTSNTTVNNEDTGMFNDF